MDGYRWNSENCIANSLIKIVETFSQQSFFICEYVINNKAYVIVSEYKWWCNLLELQITNWIFDKRGVVNDKSFCRSWHWSFEWTINAG